MNLKKNKPFVLRNKELDESVRLYNKRLTLFTVLFSFAVPLLVNGFLSYTYSYYIENNASLVFLDALLYYFIKLATAAAQYVCYAVLITTLYTSNIRFGIKQLTLNCIGIFFTCILVTYTVSCMLPGGPAFYDLSDIESAESFFYGLFTAVLLCVKNIALFLICSRKKFTQLGYCIFFFSVSFAIDIVINGVNTFFEVLIGGAPENLEHYLILAEPFLESVFENIFGLFVAVFTVKLFEKHRQKLLAKFAN